MDEQDSVSHSLSVELADGPRDRTLRLSEIFRLCILCRNEKNPENRFLYEFYRQNSQFIHIARHTHHTRHISSRLTLSLNKNITPRMPHAIHYY